LIGNEGPAVPTNIQPSGLPDAVAASALDQRVVEDRLVVIFTGDDGDLVPCAGVLDPLVVDLGSEAPKPDKSSLVC
jgi:hypothetical protein